MMPKVSDCILCDFLPSRYIRRRSNDFNFAFIRNPKRKPSLLKRSRCSAFGPKFNRCRDKANIADCDKFTNPLRGLGPKDNEAVPPSQSLKESRNIERGILRLPADGDHATEFARPERALHRMAEPLESHALRRP
ncbi:MAG: hypothetical protein ACRERE_31355 [Candidatus Entotheonellia bacterium]